MITVIAVVACGLLLGISYWLYLKQKTKVQQIDFAEEPASYEATLQQGITDALQMIAHASASGIALNKPDIETILEAHRAGSSMTAAQEAGCWAAVSSIAKSIAPATIETLRASSSPSANQPSLASLAAGKYRLRTIFALIALLLFQIYWLVGATVISDLKEIRTRLEKLQVEAQKSAETLADLNTTDPDYASEKIKLDLAAGNFNDRLWEERITAWADLEILRKWNAAKFLFIGVPTPSKPPSTLAAKSSPQDQSEPPPTETPQPQGPEIKPGDFFLYIFSPENAQEMQTAQIILTALIKYILPILYGALGASAYIIRSLANEIKDSSYSLGSRVRYELRFYLGAVAGLSIAWFTADSKSADTSGLFQSLSPLALAFLAGYSVELLFSLLDRLVSAFSAPEPKRVP